MPHPKVKLADNSGNEVGVTDNRLNVNAYLSATPTIDIGDVSLLLGGTAADANAGDMSDQTLRVTIASNDTHFGTVGEAADTDGTIHGQLRAIANGVTGSHTELETIDTSLNSIENYTAYQLVTTGDQYSEGDVHTVGIVRNDTLASLVTDDNDYAPLQVNASGALYVDIADGGQLDTIIDTLETTLTAIETDQAAIEVLLTGMDVDTNAIKGYSLNINNYTSAIKDAVEGTLTVGHGITGGADGVTTVSSAGTDVVLQSSTACKKIDIQAQTDNTGLIAVGFTGVDATEATGTGVILYAGDTYSLEINNTNLIYIDSTVSGEGVRYTYFT